ncbi:MAG: hypothetical protein B6D61_11995 [Bacteroidetes bacterium 4484_249]|nr:MAG: hypothetical protein B6D61_11995 [Bacteroidetes bacterium 4484_249]
MKIKKPLILNSAIAVVLLTFWFGHSGCDKEDTSEFVGQAEIVAEYLRAEDYMADLFGLLHSSIYDTALIRHGQAFIDSTFVTYQLDTVSVIGTFFYDFSSPNQPESTRQVYGGSVTAKLYQPFQNEGALMHATFNNYTVNGYLLQGEIKYQNTGEVVDGMRKYLLGYNLDIFWEEQKILSFNPARDLFWAEGFDTPEDVDDDEFTLPDGATASYFSPDGTGPGTVPIEVTFTESWTIGISCFRYFRHGALDVMLEIEGRQITLNGEFVDADLDNCADKVMIKNFDGSLGYPYYL